MAASGGGGGLGASQLRWPSVQGDASSVQSDAISTMVAASPTLESPARSDA
jgi:hypothetical protein